MNDIIDKLSCGSLIQHGPFNDRIYLLQASNNDIYSLPSRLIGLAKEKNYGKVFAKLSENKSLPFLSEGFTVEARIPGMYPRDREGLFLAYYLDENRKDEDNRDLYEKNLHLAKNKHRVTPKALDLSQFKLRACNENDLPEMSEIYKEVFPTYPFPIHDVAYLKKTMSDNVDYFCIEHDEENLYAEMTDFATLPDWRGHGFALNLLHRMEKAIKKQGYHMAFTIARSASAGMNITFAKAGYAYGGRLKNNTNISGNIESMNIWYKKIS